MIEFDRDNLQYKEDLHNAICQIDKETFRDKIFLVTGATGMIGTFLIDVLMLLNSMGYNIRVYALGRSKQRAESRLGLYMNNDLFSFIEQDIRKELPLITVDYIVSGASNAHPKAYQADLVGTMMTNVVGTYNVLELARLCHAKVLLLSTVEIYGENRGDTVAFNEEYTGDIPLTNPRQCYPESKRAAEVLVQSYYSQYGVESYIVRLSRSFGPTMIESDSKASAQFLRNAKFGQDIVLKSNGEQLFSYTYTADVISAMLFVLQKGIVCVPYNVTGKQCDVRLREFAKIVAQKAKTQVAFDLPADDEKKGFSLVQRAVMDSSNIEKIGWKPMYSMECAIERTLAIMK
ncbi:MAG: NAD-dependent epimerase/dehydratase family protein [Bacteroidales bacterium]|nr:NAD-dependent epimerase/dehydratase family protein [Bacteroidales bacterium]